MFSKDHISYLWLGMRSIWAAHDLQDDFGIQLSTPQLEKLVES